MLHSDQSPEANRGTHLAQKGRCAACNRNVGWWRGVVVEDKQGAKWVCAACALLTETESVFPPEGYVRWWIHDEAWRRMCLPEISNRIAKLEHTVNAIPLAIAWGLETEAFDRDALRKGHFHLNGMRQEKPVYFPVVVKRPAWWGASSVPILHNYLGSPEEQDIAGVMREVLGVPGDAEWVRADYVFPREFRWDWTDPWPKCGKWAQRLPDSHPDAAKGVDKLMLLPLAGMRVGEDFSGYEIQRDSRERMDAAILAVIQSRCHLEGETRPPSLWEAFGWQR